MTIHDQFDIPKLKASVCDLAAKTKQLKRYRVELYAKFRAGEARPTIEHKDSESSIVLLETYQVLQKLRTRSFCSRYHQLAYGFVRGRNYRTMEAWTRPDHRPSAFELAGILADFMKPPEASSPKFLEHVRALVEEWLAEPSQRATCLSEAA